MKIKQTILCALILMVGFLGLMPVLNVAADSKTAITCGVNAAAGAGGCAAKPTSSLNATITTAINIFSVVAGIVAVVMLIVAGFRYVTSGGATDKVAGAKNTLLYAIIGLIIVALSQIIVKFVLDKTVNG